MGNLVIIDTSIFIDHLRTACHEEWIRSLTGIIRTSAVVLAELWRGATKAGEQRFLRALARNHPILAGVKPFASPGSLYRNTGLSKDVEVLLTGTIPGHIEPVAWTRRQSAGKIAGEPHSPSTVAARLRTPGSASRKSRTSRRAFIHA